PVPDARARKTEIVGMLCLVAKNFYQTNLFRSPWERKQRMMRQLEKTKCPWPRKVFWQSVDKEFMASCVSVSGCQLVARTASRSPGRLPVRRIARSRGLHKAARPSDCAYRPTMSAACPQPASLPELLCASADGQSPVVAHWAPHLHRKRPSCSIP